MSNNLGNRKCGCGCRQPATGGNGVTAWASIDCAVRIAEKRRAKKEQEERKAQRKLFRERRENAKRTPDLRAEAQTWFHRWVREVRDADQPCISCGRMNLADPLTGGAWDCGHYRSRGAARHLAFDERNVAKQCKHCNRDKAGDSLAMRAGLVERHGLAFVEELEADNEPRRFRAHDYRAIRDKYRVLVLQARKAACKGNQ